MTAAIQAIELGKRYGQRWALTDCDLEIPSGRVVGGVGPNGAGKTTLVSLAVGLLAPTLGSISVPGARHATDSAQLRQVGFVAQDTPTDSQLGVPDHLRLAAHMNPGWDSELAKSRIEHVDLGPDQLAGSLAGGQRTQVALTLAMAKRPELLVLDELVASPDSLARREFREGGIAFIAEHEVSVVLSSHLVADLERVCDYLVVLTDSRVRVAGEVDKLRASHYRLIGTRRDLGTLPGNQKLIEATEPEGQSTVLVRTEDPVLDPAWTVEQIGLEDLVQAYMRHAANPKPVRETVVGAQR